MVGREGEREKKAAPTSRAEQKILEELERRLEEQGGSAFGRGLVGGVNDRRVQAEVVAVSG